MPYERKDNSGSLWLEPKQKISQKTNKPYTIYSGDCVIDGKAMRISAFRNTVKVNGEDKEVYNMSFTLKQQGDATYADDGTKIPF